jgi:predicted enzyme related to lactoylglutathione lyase
MSNTTAASRAYTHRRLIRRLACGAFCLVIGSACASPPPPWLPPVTPTPTPHVNTGKFVWSDLVTQDVDAAKAFYSELFGWTFSDTDRYTLILRDSEPIGGILKARDPKRRSEWVGNLSVADVDRAAELARQQGGVVETEPVDAPSRGRIAVISDPEGALVLLLRSSAGDPADAEAPLNSFFWWELWSQDTDSATRFYAGLADYETETTVFREQSYHVLKRGEVPRAGILLAPPDVPPQWLPYVRVADAEALADRAAELGGRVYVEDSRSAILVDPTGAPIAIQVWDKGDRPEEEAAR